MKTRTDEPLALLRPIRSELDHARAVAAIDSLWGAPDGSPEAEQLDVLVTLVDAYEREHHAIAPPDPVDAIRFRMEQQGLTRADLEPLLGSRARVSEILNRRRPLTLPMIRRLRDHLGLSADTLIGPATRGP
jgi:HTH-type transcriptional regulator / antitoxin HigA